MTLPSKELMSEVFGDFIRQVWECDGKIYTKSNNFLEEYNIYELAHKCKEWALTQGYTVQSYTNTHFCEATLHGVDVEINPNYFGDSEPEAIFEACQWVLENR